jgi:hypothetical protein
MRSGPPDGSGPLGEKSFGQGIKKERDMMRKFVFVMMFFMCVGCAFESNEFRDFINNSKILLQDPHYAQYKEKRDALEKQYLQKKITYAEYIEKRDRLDLNYAKEVQERTKIIEGEK